MSKYSKLVLVLLIFITSNTLFSQSDTIYQSDEGDVLMKPYLWYKADNILNSGHMLHDYTGHGHNGILTDGFALSDSIEINYNRSFLFDNPLKDIRIADVPLENSRLNVFTVYKSLNKGLDQQLWMVYFDSAHVAGITTKRLQTFTMSKKYREFSSTAAILNSASVGWLNMDVDSNSYISLGNKDSVNFQGFISEFMLYNSMLDSLQIAKIQTYLAIKYGLTLLDCDYVGSNGDLFWSHKENKYYHNEIGCISYDTVFGLNQKQSRAEGSENMISIGLGSISTTNDMNSGIINQGDYIIWGSNKKDISTILENQELNEISNLSEKRWLVQVGGESLRGKQTQLWLDAKELDFEEKIFLVIDRSGQNEFTSENVQIYEPDTIYSDSTVQFSNILWDNDNSGKDVFTFIIGDKLTLQANGNVDDTSGFGKINMQVYGGKESFNYKITHIETSQVWQWSSNSRNQVQNGLPYGEYMVSLIDSKEAKDTAFVFINKNKSYKKNDNIENLHTINNENITKAIVYPNPSFGSFTVEMSLKNASRINMLITNTEGKTIKTKDISKTDSFKIQQTLNTVGVYYIRLQTSDGEEVTLPITIQK